MVTIQEDYPEIVREIEEKRISPKEIDQFFIDFIKNQIQNIKEGKREDMDIGDVFPIYSIAINKGYRFNKKLEELIIKLGDYKLEINGKYSTEMNSIVDVEKALEEILQGLKKTDLSE